MDSGDTASLMLLISAFIAISLLLIAVSLFRKTYFKDLEKSFESPLCDSPQDLANAIELENKQNKQNKQKQQRKQTNPTSSK